MDDLRNAPVAGVEACIDGRHALGRRDFAAALALGAGVWVGDDAAIGASGNAIAARPKSGWAPPRACWHGFALSDIARPQTPALLDALDLLGIRTHLISGDNVEAVRWWADQFGMEAAHGAVTPEGKRAYVAALQEKGAVVLAVGDGINDAPVLAQAQVSIAIGSGAPLAQAGADAVLTHGGVAEIAPRHRRCAAHASSGAAEPRLGLFYNIVAIPLAATGLAHGLDGRHWHVRSSLLVVANACAAMLRQQALAPTRHRARSADYGNPFYLLVPMSLVLVVLIAGALWVGAQRAGTTTSTDPAKPSCCDNDKP